MGKVRGGWSLPIEADHQNVVTLVAGRTAPKHYRNSSSVHVTAALYIRLGRIAAVSMLHCTGYPAGPDSGSVHFKAAKDIQRAG